MISVLMASGIGTRLWPMSTDKYPKQYLKLLDSDNSMLRQTYLRARTCGDDVYLIVLEQHLSIVKEQFPDVPESRIIVTPFPNGTASCVLIALDVMARQGVDKNEALAFLTADHAIKDTAAFERTMKKAAVVSEEQHAITLIGIPPTYPATGFGYIKKSGPAGEGYGVDSFKEKPDLETAKVYLESGEYVWNSGYYVGSAQVIRDAIKKDSAMLDGELALLTGQASYPGDAYLEAYKTFENVSLEVALLEKSADVYAVDAEFDWADVGTYKDLHDTVEKDADGNYFHNEKLTYAIDTTGSYVRSDEDKPIAVIGLSDIIVVNTAEGLLVARKDMSQLAGDIAKTLAKEKA